MKLNILIMDGYSKSLSTPTLEFLVKDTLIDMCVIKTTNFFVDKAWFRVSQRRKIREFIINNQDENSQLLLFGKSLGAYNIVQAINGLYSYFESKDKPITYKYIHLVTVDINWPLFFDWRPNLNNTVLKIRNDIFYKRFNASNVFNESSDKKKQVGSWLGVDGHAVLNIPVVGYDHYSIIQSEQVLREIKRAIRAVGCI